MIITWYGQSCFKIQSGDLIIAIDPFSKDIGLTPPRFRCDVTLVTHAHSDHANSASLAGEPFLIMNPGEYEIKGVYVRGIATYHDAEQGKERGMNTMYIIELEGLRLLHMGDFGEKELRDETVEDAGEVHVLFVPVGGTYTIAASAAASAVKRLEPRIVIPMHYKIPGLTVKLETADAFLKEMGVAKTQPQDKLALKKKDLEGKETTEVVVLKTA